MRTRGFRLAALAVLCVGTLGFSGCDRFTSDQERLARAEQLMRQGSYQAAALELRKIIQKTPQSAQAQLAVARVCLLLGEHEAAAAALDAAAHSGADKSAISELRATLELRRGEYEALSKGLRDGSLQIAEPNRSVLLAQALGGLDRCDEAGALARSIKEQHREIVGNRVLLAECYGKHGALASALNELDQATAVAPTSAEAWLARGRLLQLTGRSKDAESSWREALKHAPGQLTIIQQLMALEQLGDLQLNSEDAAAARETHRRMAALAPDSPAVQLLGARVAMLTGDFAVAMTDLRKLTDRAPELPAPNLLLLSALVASGNLEQAAQQIARLRQTAKGEEWAGIERGVVAARDQPKDSEGYWLHAGAVQVALGQIPLARAAFVKAMQIAPGSVPAAVTLAELELRTGRPEKALPIARDLAAHHADDPRTALLLASVQQALGQYSEAAAAYEKAWASNPTAQIALALYWVRAQGRLGNESATLAEWLERHPNDQQVRASYAEALRVAGNRAAAVTQYEKIVAAAPDSAVALNNLAWLYHLQSDSRALATAEKASKIAPSSLSVRDTYGWILVQSGATNEGLKVLEETYGRGGAAIPDISFHYAAALSRSGDAARARDLLRALLRDFPKFDARPDAEKLLSSLG